MLGSEIRGLLWLWLYLHLHTPSAPTSLLKGLRSAASSTSAPMSPGCPTSKVRTTGSAISPVSRASHPGGLQAPAHVRILPFIRSPAVIGTVTSTPLTARASRPHLRAGVRGGARTERLRTARASRPRASDSRSPPGATAPPARPAHSHSASLKVAAGGGSASAPGPDPEPEAGHRKREAAPCSPPGSPRGRLYSLTLLRATGSGR